MKRGEVENQDAFIRRDDDCDSGVTLAETPGCISVRATTEEAVAQGRETQAGHVAELLNMAQIFPNQPIGKRFPRFRETETDSSLSFSRHIPPREKVGLSLRLRYIGRGSVMLVRGVTAVQIEG